MDDDELLMVQQHKQYQTANAGLSLSSLCSNKRATCLQANELVILKRRFDKGRLQMEKVHEQMQEVIFMLSRIGIRKLWEVIAVKSDPASVDDLQLRAQILFDKRLRVSRYLQKAVEHTVTYYSGFPCRVFGPSYIYFPPELQWDNPRSAVVDYHARNLSELFRIFAYVLRVRIFMHDLYRLLREINPKIEPWKNELSLTEFIAVKRETLKKVKICEVKMRSNFFQKRINDCLDFIHPDNFLHQTNMWGLDYKRAVLLTHHLKVVFSQKHFDEPPPKLSDEFDKIDFLSADLKNPIMMNVNLMYGKEMGINMESNRLKQKFTKMSYEK